MLPRLNTLQGELSASLRVAQNLRIGETNKGPADALHLTLPFQIVSLHIRTFVDASIQLNRRLRLRMSKIYEAALDLPIYYIALFKLLYQPDIGLQAHPRRPKEYLHTIRAESLAVDQKIYHAFSSSPA